MSTEGSEGGVGHQTLAVAGAAQRGDEVAWSASFERRAGAACSAHRRAPHFGTPCVESPEFPMAEDSFFFKGVYSFGVVSGRRVPKESGTCGLLKPFVADHHVNF